MTEMFEFLKCGEYAVSISYRRRWHGQEEQPPLVTKVTVAGRPLVVIDPEDAAQVERIVCAVENLSHQAQGYLSNHLQDALRSLIADPKPEEPTGLGAVVEDVHGHRWIYAPSGLYLHHWQGIDSRRDWSNIDAVKVLSEGVTA